MEAIWQEIGISAQHICETSVTGRFQLICDKQWLQALEQQRKIAAFPSCAQLDRRAHPLGALEHPWTRILVQTYRKRPQLRVYPLVRTALDEHPTSASADEEATEWPTPPLTYSQAVAHVTSANFKNLWEAAYKRYPAAHIKFYKPQRQAAAQHIGIANATPSLDRLLSYDEALREIVQRIFHCPLVHCLADRCAARTTTTSPSEEATSMADSQPSEGMSACSEMGESHANILPALAAIETSTHISVFFYPPAVTTSLYECIAYSPAMLSKSYNKPLFLVYQLLHLMRALHAGGLLLGDLRLHDILLRDNLWLQVVPRLEANLMLVPTTVEGEAASDGHALKADAQRTPPHEATAVEALLSPAHREHSGPLTDATGEALERCVDLHFAYDLDQFTLREYCELWCHGQLSNYDYLTILNHAAGRSINNPAHHHIMPWVSDLAARNGSNWRDLTKSKYRLNKGDLHLDLMFAQAHQHAGSSASGGGGSSIGVGLGGGCGGGGSVSGLTAGLPLGGSSLAGGVGDGGHGSAQHTLQVPHHVSDFLSEITYFVYMARRTPQHILRAHVRPIWVPAEYPASIQRLQEWSPDECIPEFYADPMIFKSIHEDLPDLEVPVWATCPEDFVAKHREALESQYVSERLQHWIDLNFGYKLSGKAAVKAKNVFLSVADQHRQLCQRGIVQLFTQPHPPKRFPSPWFESAAPRLGQPAGGSGRGPFHISPHQQRRRSSHRQLSESSKGVQHARSNESLNSSGADTAALGLAQLEAPAASAAQSGGGTPLRSGGGGASPRLTLRTPTSQSACDDQAQLSANSTSSFYASTNFIELPKDFQPAALLQSLETQQHFFARTFPRQKACGDAHEKMSGSDLLFDQPEASDRPYSYTNQLFSSTSGAAGTSTTPTRGKSLLAPSADPTRRQTHKQLTAAGRARELQTLGCLIVELFAVQRLRPLLMNSATVGHAERVQACRTVIELYRHELPKCLRYAVQQLLLAQPNSVTIKGLPAPTPAQLLEPIFSNQLMPFPAHYYGTYALIRSLHTYGLAGRLLDLHTHFYCSGRECERYADIDRQRVLIERKVAECRVMACCAHLGRLLEPTAFEQFSAVELLLPHIVELLSVEQTAILAAWNLFDPLAQALGVAGTQRHLLAPIMRLYDVEGFDAASAVALSREAMDEEAQGGASQLRFSISSSFKSRKSVKLYHHSFLLRLIVRFGLACFLRHFTAPLIEAVGGHKEPENGTGYHYHSNAAAASLGSGGGGGGGAPIGLDQAGGETAHSGGGTRRSSKHLNDAASVPETLMDDTTMVTPTPTDAGAPEMLLNSVAALSLAAAAVAAVEEKPDIEDVFSFDEDVTAGACPPLSGGGSTNSTAAEEASEYDTISLRHETTPEKLAISEIIYGATAKMSNASFDEPDKLSLGSQTAPSDSETAGGETPRLGPQSPTIAIPASAFCRSFQLNTIDCDIGSRKSIDSFEAVAVVQTPAATNTSMATTTTMALDQDQDQEAPLAEVQAVAGSPAAATSSDSPPTLPSVGGGGGAGAMQSDRIAEMSAESLVWLSHRLGPALTSRHIARNLLKMLSLCYVGQENLLPETALGGSTPPPPPSSVEPGAGLPTGRDLNYFTVADARVVGDRSAARVLDCLMSIAALFGEELVLLQYLPHMSELIALAGRRLTSSLEGAIIGAMQLLKCVVPCLRDATIMEHLHDQLLNGIVRPVLQLLASTSRPAMPSGYLGRSVLARKWLDALYVLSVRIGPEMSKEHLCVPALRPYFLIFNKSYGIAEHFQAADLCVSPPRGGPGVEGMLSCREQEELHDVFGPALAHAAYLAFLRFLGEAIMQRTVVNLEFILTLCHEFVQPEYAQVGGGGGDQTATPVAPSSGAISPAVDCPTRRHELSPHDGRCDSSLANSFGSQVIGNRIEVVSPTSQASAGQNLIGAGGSAASLAAGEGLKAAMDGNKGSANDGGGGGGGGSSGNVCPMEVLDMVAFKFDHVPTTRHLKGNWLAYWRHEISRPEKDVALNLKQIRLQSFVGHANSVRAIHALDNENSFISASKDKTVKLWSLRSEGDGRKTTACQFTYTAHRKAVHSLGFLDAMRLVVSCDGGVHLWDPFIGRPLGVLDAYASVTGSALMASAAVAASKGASPGSASGGGGGGGVGQGTSLSCAGGGGGSGGGDARSKHNPITVIKCWPTPSPLIAAGTAEAAVRLIDARCMQYVNEWRVTPLGGSSGATVRCLAIAPSGNWLAAGLSSGSIVMLDARTGMVLNAWRPMECDLLQLNAPNDQQLVSSALDHSLAVWHAHDGILHYQLKPPPEPAHCLQTIGSQLVFATTGNRIGVYSDLASSHAAHSVTKLRSENFRGVLTSLAVLPLNRAFLAGNESGNIALLC